MLKSVHYCPDASQFYYHEYRDATSSTSNLPPASSITLQTDEQGRPLQARSKIITRPRTQLISTAPTLTVIVSDCTAITAWVKDEPLAYRP